MDEPLVPQSPIPQTPGSAPTPVVPQPTKSAPVMQTYQDDLSKAMDATDATVVQELLETARERESVAKDEVTKGRQRKWYVTLSIVFIILAIGMAAYGIRYYMRLTVPVQQNFSVGVFGSTEPYVASTTSITAVLQSLREKSATVPEHKPLLVPLVTDATTLSPISKADFFSFINATPTEPLAASFDTIRLGVINTGTDVVPFIIASVPDPEVGSKELLIAETDILNLFYKALAIDLSAHADEVGKGFTGGYMYNIPIRTLTYYDVQTGIARPLILYGYVTERTVVMTTSPDVLKSIYETIIRQL